jgi:hypothetical protein
MLAGCGEPADEMPPPDPVEFGDTLSWLLDSWEGDCYSWQSTEREEEWVLGNPGASQNQYYCGSTHLIYTPRSFSSWRIAADTLRFALAAGTDQIVKFRIDRWGSATDDQFSMYKIVDTGWVWVPYRRAQ